MAGTRVYRSGPGAGWPPTGARTRDLLLRRGRRSCTGRFNSSMRPYGRAMSRRAPVGAHPWDCRATGLRFDPLCSTVWRIYCARTRPPLVKIKSPLDYGWNAGHRQRRPTTSQRGRQTKPPSAWICKRGRNFRSGPGATRTRDLSLRRRSGAAHPHQPTVIINNLAASSAHRQTTLAYWFCDHHCDRDFAQPRGLRHRVLGRKRSLLLHLGTYQVR